MNSLDAETMMSLGNSSNKQDYLPPPCGATKKRNVNDCKYLLRPVFIYFWVAGPGDFRQRTMGPGPITEKIVGGKLILQTPCCANREPPPPRYALLFTGVLTERGRGLTRGVPVKASHSAPQRSLTPSFAIVLCEIPKRRARMRTNNSLRFLNGCHLPQRNVPTLPTKIRNPRFWRPQIGGFRRLPARSTWSSPEFVENLVIRSGVSFLFFAALSVAANACSAWSSHRPRSGSVSAAYANLLRVRRLEMLG